MESINSESLRYPVLRTTKNQALQLGSDLFIEDFEDFATLEVFAMTPHMVH